ncbi:MAG: indole-3-glycerol phosphate synthase TrpC [Pseudomonadota bacterium]|nr:indole-3-glycerol phosphate synthase TrpC [Pseudomonadota bacterium]
MSNHPPDILKKILAYKAEHLSNRAKQCALTTLSQRAAAQPPPRGFVDALLAQRQQQQIAIIAEIKKASPSKGLLRADFQPVQIAQSYERHGATCLSVLTDEAFFQGADHHLQQAHKACSLPILRKDFIIDAYQVYEARVLGADCILLIVAALDDAQLHELAGLATHLGLDVLVEVHDAIELQRALALNTPLIGINNRDLHTFQTRLTTTLELLKAIPQDRLVVSESGLHTAYDLAVLIKAGVSTFLIGEAFMSAADPGLALAQLLKPV